jgi:hypothetical protein
MGPYETFLTVCVMLTVLLNLWLHMQRLPVGTKSILFGVHQVFIHPWFVAAAWYKLYGRPLDLRLWAAFFVHDIGYWGKHDMDGAEGETHVELGAKIMAWLFDWPVLGIDPFMLMHGSKLPAGYKFFGLKIDRSVHTWHDFSLYHSRFYSTNAGVRHSRLCVADKLAFTLYPCWLYLLLANMSGEINDYMNPETEKYRSFLLEGVSSQEQWFYKLKQFIAGWVEAAIESER